MVARTGAVVLNGAITEREANAGRRTVRKATMDRADIVASLIRVCVYWIDGNGVFWCLEREQEGVQEL